ncbi:uncharacterized protein L969DRAFT_88698 [Mixia osmundae IAM 14324]|uniref:Amino acid transporter transmembrane domain-containing protein n=1 Tax=Mixia osmundae (strain CBS 9802 / IAM 14324 / JCM 22182 / KY 12970) TaxID=764103 RepID=G7DZ45_MIXOS|nr:uncharacterized protein L969DRAFT_88698 [Mixia osmundae IAM 14324]KEI38256.1 hypothetical protein L969DRAFT_88698 [Mixia osmundae IAM 14324]GAA95855.1 hypothetical protein E5Q_02512 [Mixia osmundae IAM 14324]
MNQAESIYSSPAPTYGEQLGSHNGPHDGAPMTADNLAIADEKRTRDSKDEEATMIGKIDTAAATTKVRDEGEDSSIGDRTAIETKNLTWVQASFLLLTEYIVVAILSFPQSYAALGLAGGLITTVIVGGVVLATSLILTDYCIAHPELIDICDIAYELFGHSRIAYELAAIGFLLNNVFIMGLHVVIGSVALNTLTDHPFCTLIFSALITVVTGFASLPRSLSQVSYLGMIGAFFMAIALLLALILAGVESAPAMYTGAENIKHVGGFAHSGTTFVVGFSAVLNIIYTFVGQILIPSYVSEMREPRDFKKALWIVTIFEIVLYGVGGSVIYYYVGSDLIVSPAYGALQSKYAKIVAGFTLPTIIAVGIVYSVITSRFILFRIFEASSIHRRAHTVKGWVVWTGIVITLWAFAFIIAGAVPFFSDLLSLLSSLFDSFFGFIFWAFAYKSLNKGNLWSSPARIATTVFYIFVLLTGLFMLTAGTYASAESIKASYSDGTVSSPFSCANTGY